jgi:hypothetical protein
MKSRNVSLIAGIGSLLIMMLPLGMVIKTVSMKKNGVKVSGTVTDRDTRGKGLPTITVVFTTKEDTEVTASTTKRNYAINGDKVDVWYDPKNPEKITFGDTIGYNMRGVVITGLLAVFLFYLFFRAVITEKKRARLKSAGLKISLEYLVDRNDKFRMGDNNPWVIRARWTDSKTNRDYTFESDSYTIDPAPYLAGRLTVDVSVDPGNPSIYFMDTSFMPGGNITMGS